MLIDVVICNDESLFLGAHPSGIGVTLWAQVSADLSSALHTKSV